MDHEVMKRDKKLIYRVVMTVFVSLLLSGLFGCSMLDHYIEDEADEIVRYYASSYGMARRPTYAFSLRKEEGHWFFSASCYVNSPWSHYTSFSSFQIPDKDAERFLALIRKNGEIGRLRKYRKPFWTSFLKLSDEPSDYSGMTFADSSRLERDTSPSQNVKEYLYYLAEKHCREAESVEICIVTVRSGKTDAEHPCYFTLETDGYDWFFSFSTILDCAGGYAEEEKLPIQAHDAEEVLRIIKEQQLIVKAKEYKEPTEDSSTAPGEMTYQISFWFMDGSSISAPIYGETELMDILYSLAEANYRPG